MCLECYKYSRLTPCECLGDDGEPIVFCRSCVMPCQYCKIESCQKCIETDAYCSVWTVCDGQQPCAHKLAKLRCACPPWMDRRICKDCTPKECHSCSRLFCIYCMRRCQICRKATCNKCSSFFGDTRFCKNCFPYPGIINFNQISYR